MMEQNSNRIGKFVKKFLLNDTEWYLLRYKLIKRIHIHESMIRSEVPSNQQYFAYLLKTQLPDIEFSRLIESEYLPVGVSVFRNTLITEILKIDLSETLDKDIHKSIKISSKRIYSS
jgi:hypothetical protein